jgi:hypothetical protein
METAFRILLRIQIMMAIGMHSIVVAQMELLGHKDHKAPRGQMVCKVRREQMAQLDLRDLRVRVVDSTVGI